MLNNIILTMKCLLLFMFFKSSIEAAPGCPIIDNPSQMFQCLTLNPQAFIDLISKKDYKSFCHMANGYMTCMSTYVRDCLGGKAATGILEELQDLNLKCCISGKTQDCVVKNPSLLQKCFSSDNSITLSDGSYKSIMNIKIGDFVKAIDSNGNLIDSEIVSILHKDSNTTTLFQVIYDSFGNSLSLTSSHLLFIQNRGYVNAAKVQIGDNLRIYSTELKKFNNFKVDKISFDFKTGFIAPLTNEGTLLVNNIHTSCYAEINSHLVAHLAVMPMKLWYKISKLIYDSNQAETNNVEISFLANFLYNFVSNYIPSLLSI